MFIIKKESNEYVDNGVYCSYETVRLFGIKLYVKIFTTTNMGVIQQFVEQQEEPHERKYHDPVVVTGFQNK